MNTVHELQLFIGTPISTVIYSVDRSIVGLSFYQRTEYEFYTLDTIKVWTEKSEYLEQKIGLGYFADAVDHSEEPFLSHGRIILRNA